MPDHNPDSTDRKLIAALGDASRLRQRGVSEAWIQNCADVVAQYAHLQKRRGELERELANSDPPSPDDTIVF